jgi:hypothetical protein
MGFAAGLNAGVHLGRQYNEKERNKVLDERATEEYDRKKAGWQREDAAWDAAPTNTAIPAPGGNVQQVASDAAVGAVDADTGVPAAPAAALPARAAAPSRQAMEDQLMRVAVARRDPTAMRTAATAQRGAGIQSLMDEVGKVPLDEIVKGAGQLNTNSSNLPMTFSGKGKGGYVFTTIDPETGAPGQRFNLNEAQMRQLYAAHKLGEAGFGTEAMELAGKTHSAINDAMGKYNELINKNATQNNQATRFANSDEQDAARTGIMAANGAAQREATRARTAMDRMGSAQMMQDDAGNTFAIVPTMTKNGLVMERVQLNDEQARGLKPFSRGGSGSGGAPREVPAPGTVMQDSSGVWKSDGRGGRLGVDAPMPEQRAKILSDAGMAPGFAEQMQWDRTGQFINYGNQMWDSANAKDMKALAKAVKDDAAFAQGQEEEARALPGLIDRRREESVREMAPKPDFNPYYNPQRSAFQR